MTGERAPLHLFESQGENAIRQSPRHELVGHEESGRAGGAVVVHVVDGDPGHAALVQGTLAAGGIACKKNKNF